MMRTAFPQGALRQFNEELENGWISPDEYREKLRGLPREFEREYRPRVGQAGRKRARLTDDVWDTVFQYGPMTGREIARVLQVDPRSVSMTLQHLFRQRRVARSGEGGYGREFVWRAVP
jgi:hypothetical protein